jgi:hypothetical protein
MKVNSLEKRERGLEAHSDIDSDETPKDASSANIVPDGGLQAWTTVGGW